MWRVFTLFLLSLGFLAACQTPPPAQSFAELTWAHTKPFTFDVGAVEIVSKYAPSLKKPHVEHLFPVALDTTVRQWAEDRIRAGGQSGWVIFTIKKINAIEVPLETEGGIEGYFTDEPSERYDLEVEVSIEVRDKTGLVMGFVSAKAKREQSILESATLNERQHILYTMTEALMRDLNVQLEANIGKYLKDFLL